VSERQIELTWRCTSCGQRNLGRHLVCQSCGNPKDDSEAYEMPPDPSQVASVTDPRLLRQATAGANWRCAFCGSDSRAFDGSCAQCGATQREGAAVARRVSPEIAQARAGVVPRAPLLWIAFGLIAVLLLCGVGLLVTARSRPAPALSLPSEPDYRDLDARVDVAHWKQSVTVERWAIRDKEGFEEQKPKDAFDVRPLGERVHHVDKVQQGTTTETYTETVTEMENETYSEQDQCGQDCTTTPQSCHEECTNNNNGYATCHTVCSGGGQTCSPRYCTVQKTRMVPKPKQVERTRTVPKMVDVPRMAAFFHWKQWDWGVDRSLSEQGEGFSTRWPSDERIALGNGTKKGEKERERRDGEYAIDLVASDGTRVEAHPRSAEEFAKYENAIVTVRVHRYGGSEVVSGPRPASSVAKPASSP
jgi:hypothetical protein